MDTPRDVHERERTFLLGIGHPEPEKVIKEVDMDVSIASIAADIQAKKHVGYGQAYKLARREMLKHERPLQEGFSKKDAILEALLRINSRAGVNTDALAAQLKAMEVRINIQEMTALVWDLSKQQFVVFREGHAKGGSTIERIRLTAHGRAQANTRRGDAPGNATEYDGPKVARGSRLSHQVGRDMTQAANHSSVAQGGPVERFQAPVVTLQEILPPVEIEKPAVPGDPLPQNMKAPIGVTYGTKLSLSEYPLLIELVQRQVKADAIKANAAKMVEAAALIADIDSGQSDILLARANDMESTAELSALEIEILRFIEKRGAA